MKPYLLEVRYEFLSLLRNPRFAVPVLAFPPMFYVFFGILLPMGHFSSAAAKNPALVIDACKAFPGKIAVGIDARDGFVASEGWAETSSLPAVELGLKFEDAGVSAIIYTDISRDGMLQGLNLDATLDLAGRISTPVIASGGVGTVDDLVQLRARAATAPGRIDGAIVGRALYDGRVTVPDAIRVLRGE